MYSKRFECRYQSLLQEEVRVSVTSQTLPPSSLRPTTMLVFLRVCITLAARVPHVGLEGVDGELGDSFQVILGSFTFSFSLSHARKRLELAPKVASTT